MDRDGPDSILPGLQARATPGVYSTAYFPIVKGTANSVFSHAILRTPPPEEFFSTVIVSWSAALSVEDFLRGMRARSSASLYCVPHWPICLLMISFDSPLSSGSMYKE